MLKFWIGQGATTEPERQAAFLLAIATLRNRPGRIHRLGNGSERSLAGLHGPRITARVFAAIGPASISTGLVSGGGDGGVHAASSLVPLSAHRGEAAWHPARKMKEAKG